MKTLSPRQGNNFRYQRKRKQILRPCLRTTSIAESFAFPHHCDKGKKKKTITFFVKIARRLDGSVCLVYLPLHSLYSLLGVKQIRTVNSINRLFSAFVFLHIKRWIRQLACIAYAIAEFVLKSYFYMPFS